MTNKVNAYTSTLLDSSVFSLASQVDGKILVGGGFYTWDGILTGNIVRVNSDGTRDVAFTTNIGTGGNGDNPNIQAISVQADGKILVGGGFDTWNGTAVGRVVRLNSDGTRDTTFTNNVGTGADNVIISLAVQADNKILVAGNFTSWNGTSAGNVVRLNSDGTIDTAFSANIGTGADTTVNTVTIQPDGKILLGGWFTSWNSIAANYIIRLNSDGTRDSTFATNVGTAANNSVYSLALQADGKILVGGGFDTWNGASSGGIVRLNFDGTMDAAFSANIGTGAVPSGYVYKIAVQLSGKILVGGDFYDWNGSPAGNLVRLNSDGTKDTVFSNNIGTGGNSSAVYGIVIQPGEKILIGGTFSYWDGIPNNYFLRLNPTGILDTTYPSGLRTVTMPYTNVGGVWKPAKSIYNKHDGVWSSSFLQGGINDLGFATNIGTAAAASIAAIAVQSDGKIIVGGNFTTWNGVTVGRIVRLNLDGTLDTNFITNIGTAANAFIYAIAVQSDGKIIVGGNFTTWNGVTVGRIVRLNLDGTRDTAFTTSNGTGANGQVFTITLQSDNKILIGGYFTAWNSGSKIYLARLNANGSIDTTFVTGSPTTGTLVVAVRSIVVQPDGKIVVGGGFQTWAGVTVNRIIRFSENGTRDATFTTNTGTAANNGVRSISLQEDGKMIVGGSFTTWNGTSVGYIVRLNSDGTRDTAFTTSTGAGADSSIYATLLQADGKIVVGGNFTKWSSVNSASVARLNSSGARDAAFTTNVGAGGSNAANAIALQPDKKIAVGGDFTTWSGATVGRIVRIGGEIAQ